MSRPPQVQFDSSLPPPAGAAWSAPLAPASHWLIGHNAADGATLFSHAGPLRHWTDPLQALRWMSRFELDPHPDTRWAGYLSYDLGRLFEPWPRRALDDLQFPLFAFSLHRRADSWPSINASAYSLSSHPPRSTFDQKSYLSAVARAIEYIASGDIFQVNLSQRYTLGLSRPPIDIWCRLLSATPANYGAYLDYGHFALISNSPELFLKVEPTPRGRRVLTRPIKGTRPRQPGQDDELRESIKDQAELNMIVDLERNDLGRVCSIGTVKVSQPRTIESHPTVYHGVATIEGLLRPDVDFLDLLTATFPGGSITGAPKIRALQIIEELEPTARGPYCGAIGYLTPDGRLEFNIAIRTILIKDAQAHIPAGGAIVADSDPNAEYEETRLKSQALLAAL